MSPLQERQRSGFVVTKEMDWLYPKRGPEWKRGWTSRTLASVSAPPLHLLAIFAIVIFLLSLSQYTNYKAQLQYSMINVQLFLLLLPILLIFIVLSGLTSGRFTLWPLLPDRDTAAHRTGGSPWGVAILLVVLLVLVSYQSSFHSKWFGPLSRLE